MRPVASFEIFLILEAKSGVGKLAANLRVSYPRPQELPAHTQTHDVCEHNCYCIGAKIGRSLMIVAVCNSSCVFTNVMRLRVVPASLPGLKISKLATARIVYFPARPPPLTFPGGVGRKLVTPNFPTPLSASKIRKVNTGQNTLILFRRSHDPIPKPNFGAS